VRRFKDKRLYDRGGRYIWTRVRDERGYIVRVSTRTADEKAASLFSDEWERRAADPGYRRASDATFGSAMTDWLAELTRRGVSAATYNIAEIKLGHFVRLWGESWPLLRITNDLVLQFIDRRMTEPGATRDSTVKPLTVKKELAALKQMLEWAKFRGTFPVDIATVIPPGFSGRHRPRTRAPSREEVVALLQNLEPHRAAHVAFIVATGARRAESFRACREDVDPKGLTIRIRGSKTERANDRVPITGLTRDFVLFAIQKAPSDVPLFAPWGKMNRDIAAACVRAGIDRVSPNDLRRAFGKWHRLAGATAEQVGLLLRHTTDTLAQTTYAKVSAADIGEALRDLIPIREDDDASVSEGRRVLGEASGRAPGVDEATRVGQGRDGGNGDDRCAAAKGYVPVRAGDDLRDRGDRLRASEDWMDPDGGRPPREGTADGVPVPAPSPRHDTRTSARRVGAPSTASPTSGRPRNGVVPPDAGGRCVDLRGQASVPELYVTTAPGAPSDPNASAPNTGKQASPARLERATPGLGNQSTEDGPSPRSVGNKLAHARRRKAHIVPELDGGGPTYFAWLSWGAA
jgi:integrase